MMNFSGAVKGRLSRSGAIQTIQDQAKTELRRDLSSEELRQLSTRFSLMDFVANIQKVEQLMIIIQNLIDFLVWLWLSQISSSVGQQAGLRM